VSGLLGRHRLVRRRKLFARLQRELFWLDKINGSGKIF